MNPRRPVLIIFHGGEGEGPAERLVGAARLAAGRATATAALAAGFEAVIFAAPAATTLDPLPPGCLFDPDPPGATFDFGARLRDVVARYGLERPAVMGAGSLPLLGAEELGAVVAALESRTGCVITNNFFSSDLAGWCPGSALEALSPFARDNVLPRRLRDEAGLEPVLLPRTLGTQFDLDTPADLAVLALCEDLPFALPAMAPGTLPLERYRAVMPLFCDREAELVVAGRVGSQAWQFLERETACRVRLYSEERGLATAPPGYYARSALGYLLEELGPERFFARMATLGGALVLDVRVLEAHAGASPSREDRFQGDLLRPDAIADPFLRDLIAAAAAAPNPVLIGGHSLVSGGLMALSAQAWRENDRQIASLRAGPGGA